MASMEKFTDSAVTNQFRHYGRLIEQNSNKDIDPSRTWMNYCLTPYVHVPQERYQESGVREHIRKKEQDYYTKRKSELFCYNRKDINTMVGWVVTLPDDVKEKAEQDRFFMETAAFLCHRYGEENVVSIEVHYDEGKDIEFKDASGNPLRDENGYPVKKIHIGHPHLHFAFIPVCRIDHDKIDYQLRNGKLLPEEVKKDPETGRYYIDRKFKLKDGQRIPSRNVPKGMRSKDFKISANDVICKPELQRFHSDFQAYLDSKGFHCRVMTGITAAQGGNRTVKELKAGSIQIQKVLDRMAEEKNHLQDRVNVLEKENAVLKEKLNGYENSHTAGWGKQSGWGKEGEHAWTW